MQTTTATLPDPTPPLSGETDSAEAALQLAYRRLASLVQLERTIQEDIASARAEVLRAEAIAFAGRVE